MATADRGELILSMKSIITIAYLRMSKDPELVTNDLERQRLIREHTAMLALLDELKR